MTSKWCRQPDIFDEHDRIWHPDPDPQERREEEFYAERLRKWELKTTARLAWAIHMGCNDSVVRELAIEMLAAMCERRDPKYIEGGPHDPKATRPDDLNKHVPR